MDIAFRDDKQAETFSSLRLLTREYGNDRAMKIARHLKRFELADSLADVWKGPGRPHELKADRSGQISFDLGHPYRLLIRPTDHPLPTKVDGGLDRTEVRAITVVEVADTH